jgi:polyhydroxybutyrate depolymerase
MALRAATVLLSLMGSASASKVPATPSAGCARGYETATAGTATAATLVVGNSSTATRTYTVYVPTVADRTRARSGDGLAQPLPLVLNFHGWKSTGTELMNNSDGNDVAEANGFLNVYPDGMGDHPSATLDGPSGWGSWNTGGSTASPGPAGPTCNGDHSADALCYTSCAQRPGGCDAQGCDWTTCADDLGFVEALLDHLESTMCVDRNRVYATGFSNGAMLVYTLGMALSQRFAAIAPVEGGVHPGFLSRPEVPVALLEIHGTQDVTVPINGSDGM